ncbi:SchA/CurD-like domain-containing protein [Streptomyces botrytidirepellens]|uniref:TcmI family type II polyketide cyclase n=1 Tax=Streptomyces botrytidirepellens TaxID=2486417 RepID=A0A3M8W250_9ACTN|nr:SchA/CurD-like domain-containing protein [Streptomyces botrytidirepellens]RNG24084.1 TcmI family type II polyketide cyclase [Streptomyces botrytidirepellens]
MSTLPQTPQPTTTPSTTTRSSQSSLADSRLRVVLLLDVRSGAEERFLRAYDELCQQVASVPGHLSDQLCQSIEDPSKWLITSEWESAPPFLAWVDSEAHREMVKPMHGCVEDTRSLRFGILRETDKRGRGTTAARGRLQAAPRIGDGLVRHGLTFTVKPGAEKDVAAILADYAPVETRVDDTTRLCRTSLFMTGNRVVRTVEVKGDLVAALRHVSMQPEVRAVEAAVNPHLEEPRDLDDPDAAREFFHRAALPVVHHLTAVNGRDGDAPAGPLRRHALWYPVREGSGTAVSRLLARQDELAMNGGTTPLVSSTIFQHEDVVVRMVDMRAPLDQDPALAVGVGGKRAAAVLSRLVECGPDRDLSHEDGLRRFLADCDMEPVTDRRAADY